MKDSKRLRRILYGETGIFMNFQNAQKPQWQKKWILWEILYTGLLSTFCKKSKLKKVQPSKVQIGGGGWDRWYRWTGRERNSFLSSLGRLWADPADSFRSEPQKTTSEGVSWSKMKNHVSGLCLSHAYSERDRRSDIRIKLVLGCVWDGLGWVLCPRRPV